MLAIFQICLAKLPSKFCPFAWLQKHKKNTSILSTGIPDSMPPGIFFRICAIYIFLNSQIGPHSEFKYPSFDLHSTLLCHRKSSPPHVRPLLSATYSHYQPAAWLHINAGIPQENEWVFLHEPNGEPEKSSKRSSRWLSEWNTKRTTTECNIHEHINQIKYVQTNTHLPNNAHKLTQTTHTHLPKQHTHTQNPHANTHTHLLKQHTH